MTNLSDKKLSLAVKLPRQEIVAACMILGLVIIAWTLYSVLNPGIDSTDRTVVATAVLKDRDPTLFARDTLFANDEIYRYYTPLYRWIVGQVWQIGGTFEAGFIWLLPLVMGSYLAGMFILLQRVTGNSWIALGLTVASAHYHNVMGASGWGVGSSATLGARTLFMPAAPFLTLLMLQILEKPGWRTGAIFGLLLGLATNLHPISGFHLLTISSAFLLLLHGHTYRGWQALIATGLAAVIGAWPVGWHFLRNAGKPIGKEVTFEVFSKIVTELYSMPFSPSAFKWPLFNLELTRPALDILVWFYFVLAIFFLGVYLWGRQQSLSSANQPGWVRWSWLAGGLIAVAYAHMIALFETTFIFIVVGLYIIYRFWRRVSTNPGAMHFQSFDYAPDRSASHLKFGADQLDDWLITLMGLVVLYAFVGYYLFTFIWQRFELWALTSFLTEYARSAALIYLPIYLLAGLAGSAWVKELVGAGFGSETDISVAMAVVFGLAPSAVMNFAESLPLTLLAIGLLLCLGGVVFVIKRSLRSPWSAYLSVGVLTLLLFGPPASFLTDYFPVPVTNLLSLSSLAPQPIYDPIDAELYDWVRPNTPRDSLFYGCFGPITLTHFRFRAQRSISHNWKDLTFNVHNRATLVPAYERFRKLEAGCETFDSVISTANSLNADYILISSQDAANFLPAACFVNEKYAVFTLNPNGCSAN